MNYLKHRISCGVLSGYEEKIFLSALVLRSLSYFILDTRYSSRYFLFRKPTIKEIFLYICGAIFFGGYFLYFIYHLLSVIEFVSFNEDGITIKNIFREINVAWDEILSINIDRLQFFVFNGGNVGAKWIIINTESYPRKKFATNLNKKDSGSYKIIAKSKIVEDLSKFLNTYRSDLNLECN